MAISNHPPYDHYKYETGWHYGETGYMYQMKRDDIYLALWYLYIGFVIAGAIAAMINPKFGMNTLK